MFVVKFFRNAISLCGESSLCPPFQPEPAEQLIFAPGAKSIRQYTHGLPFKSQVLEFALSLSGAYVQRKRSVAKRKQITSSYVNNGAAGLRQMQRSAEGLPASGSFCLYVYPRNPFSIWFIEGLARPMQSSQAISFEGYDGAEQLSCCASVM